MTGEPEPVFIGQGNDCTCFPVAAYNACVYAGLLLPDLAELCDFAHCRDGATIGEERVLQRASLDYALVQSEEVFQTQGIVTIMHPRFNLHAVFVYRFGTSLYLVNSLLTPTVLAVMEPSEIPLPAEGPNRRAYQTPAPSRLLR